ncbi:MAG: pseudouridine synthase [Prevotellaceae bacterium]|jgi:23S rRNA pseudouridine2605 synthase|nr:pseudouridine synthase [Prevotellaceae bacterium]
MAYKKSTNDKKNVSRKTFNSNDKSSKSYSRKKYDDKSNDGKSFKRKTDDELASTKRRFNSTDERPKRTYKRNDDKNFGRRNDDERTSTKRRFNTTDERPKRTYKRNDDKNFGRRNDDERTSTKRRFNTTDERPKRTYKRNDDKNFGRRNDDERTSTKRRFNTTDERPKRTYKRNDDKGFGRRNDDEHTSTKRRFNTTDERPKRTYKRNDDKNFRRRNDDERTSTKRRFNTTDERPKRTYKRNDDYESKNRFSDKFERKPKNYVRVSEPVDSRLRRQIKEKKAINAQTANIVEDDKARLNKFIANSGVCSRREADTFIKAGLVSVNGIVVTELGVKISTADEVLFNGERLHGEKKVYIVMNKPKGFVTTVEDPHADKTVMTIVRNYCSERIYPVGRLDKNTTGVLLFTNDGDLTKVLTHPSYGKKKIYAVGLDKNLTKNDMTRLADGIQLDDGIAFFDEIAYTDDDDKRKIGVEIHSGRNRIVRRMFEQLDYKITKLDRVYFAGLTKSKLRRGECRFLTEQEIIALKMGAYE